jgi:hypothetical protein
MALTLSPTASRGGRQPALKGINVIFFGTFHALALLAPFFFSWPAIAITLFFHWLFGGIGICLGFHRLLSHRSFKVPKVLEYAIAFLGVIISIPRILTKIPTQPDEGSGGVTWAGFSHRSRKPLLSVTIGNLRQI